MKKTATIILNRNLPKETDALVQHLLDFDGNFTDIFVVEAGSDNNKLSKYCTWHVTTPDAIKQGLRYSRGMNYGLLELWKNGQWSNYDSFFLITNDTKLPKGESSINILQEILEKNSKIGILSPCSDKWGEKELIGEKSLKYFWFIHNNAYFLRKEMLDQLIFEDDPTYFNFLFDGDNFRGYLSESEIISRAYANDWAAAITTEVFAEEEESYLLNRNQLIKTESYEKNNQLYVEEGLKWVKKKYGFNNRWQMMQFSKLFYDKFFEYFPAERSKKI